jgi:hypothetical protein
MRRPLVGLRGAGRRRRILVAGVASTAAVGAFFISNALAVHELAFQLDGDVDHTTTTSVGGTTQNLDWDSFFNSSGNRILPLPAGFTASSFDTDFVTNTNGTFNTSDNSTWATGSKDTLAITPTNWQCRRDNNLLDKNDIMNAYAAAYEPAGGDEVLYFALERNGNEGAANVGFWFLQDNNVNCESPGGNTPFSGSHTTGDLLVVSEFTNGGTVSTINVYEWVGGANGSLNTTPVASGADCESPDTDPGDEACATVNTASITTPWLTASKDSGAGHTLQAREFFEGGVNLTDSGLGGRCFNTFMASTRASQELGSNLHDFSRGSLGGCTSSVETTPQKGNGDPIPAGGLNIPTDPSDAAISVRDKATVNVTGASSFAASLTFHLCGPFPAASTTLCGTGGVLVSSQNITTNGDYFSSAATVTQAGRYCWRADFDATTTGVPDASDSRASECFVVNPVKPALTTQAGAGPVDFGQPVTDTATLGGTAHKPGTGGPAGSNGSINPATLGGDATGTITFTLWRDVAGQPNCSVLATSNNAADLNPQTRTVSGDGTYGPVSFTPNLPGTYRWVANYGGDPPNTLASDPSACLDENEDVVVRQIPTEIKTRQSWIPNDTAMISATVGNLGANGSVVFSLHDNATCSGAALYTETKSIAGGSPSETVGTTNTGAAPPNGFTITTAFADPADNVKGPYSWKVVYTPAAGDTAHTGKQSACNAEHFSVLYTNDNGPGSNLP